MNDMEKLEPGNHVWLHDDVRWTDEVEQWEREIQRLSALLYLLEKNLPEHTVSLDQHKARIAEHNAELMRYYASLDSSAETGRSVSNAQLQKQKQLITEHHQYVREAHDSFRADYQDKMAKFRELAERLLSEVE